MSLPQFEIVTQAAITQGKFGCPQEEHDACACAESVEFTKSQQPESSEDIMSVTSVRTPLPAMRISGMEGDLRYGDLTISASFPNDKVDESKKRGYE